jgi:hypothetical protein
MRLVLASQSPRRAELLDQMALNFEVVVPDIDESQISGEIAPDYVGRLACEKAAVGLGMWWCLRRGVVRQWVNLMKFSANRAVQKKAKRCCVV